MEKSQKFCFDCGYPALRPRGALARTLYNKQVADRHLANMDYSEWYSVDERLLEPGVKSLFLQSSLDAETQEFISNSSDSSDNIFLQIFYSLVKFFLSLFMSQTSINGLLGRGSMFVFSKEQMRKLTGLKDVQSTRLALLDLGAGDGSVTRVLEPFFLIVHVTEVSKPMKSQLSSKGFRVMEEEKIPRGVYDTVSCLNVLDRCDKPKTMMSSMIKSMKPDAIALIALVLPFNPYVETGTEGQRQVEELGISGKTLEEQVNSLVTQVFPQAGFKVEKWTRLPYLCEGDLSQAFYWLDDVIFVLSIDQSDESYCPANKSDLSNTEDDSFKNK